MNTNDLISRQDVLQSRPEYLSCNPNKTYSYNLGWNNAIQEWYKAIESLPSADRPKGHWESEGQICSECGERCDYHLSGTIWIDELANFCPNCGADMRQGEHEQDD